MDKIYEQFKKDSQNQLNNLKTSDIKPYKGEPLPLNITIVFRPKQETLDRIVPFIQTLKEYDPNQFFYPAENLHMTLLGRVPHDTAQARIADSLRNSVPKFKPEFHLFGVGSNQFCVSVQAYPHHFSIHELREEIRTSIGTQGEDYTVHLALYEHMEWMNIIRYTHTPTEELLATVRKNVETDFGFMKPRSVDVYLNTSKILAPEDSTLIFSLPL